MRKIITYYDCDGVLLNTIEAGRIMAKEMGIDTKDYYAFNYFFRTVDWNELIYRAGILDNAISKVKKIINDDKYIAKILTKTSGNEYEEEIKRRLFSKLLPDVELIALDFMENKDEVVDPRNNILIEDSRSNVRRWNLANEKTNSLGVGLLLDFNNPDYHHNIIDDIARFEDTDGVKKLLKYRGY